MKRLKTILFNNCNNYLNVLRAIVIFVLASALYCFINFIYAVLFGIAVMKGVCIIIIGGITIAITFLCKLN